MNYSWCGNERPQTLLLQAKLEPYAKLKLSWSLKWVTYSTTTFSFWPSLGSVTYQCLKKKKIKSFTIPPFQTHQQCDWELEFRNSEFSFMCVNVTLLVLVTGKLDLRSTHCKNGQDRFPLDAQNCKGWSQWPGMASRFPPSCKLSLFRWMQSARKGNLTQTGTNGHFTYLFFFFFFAQLGKIKLHPFLKEVLARKELTGQHTQQEV